MGRYEAQVCRPLTNFAIAAPSDLQSLSLCGPFQGVGLKYYVHLAKLPRNPSQSVALWDWRVTDATEEEDGGGGGG